MINLILFGAPGTGKGTQSLNLIKKYDLIHLSTGDILREEIANGTQIGLLAKKYIDLGHLVPDSVIFKQLYHRASRHETPKGFIFDGFPRNTAQAEILDKMLIKKNIPITKVLFLQVTEEELFNRIMSRSKHSGRIDDTPEVVMKRIEVYKSQTQPVMEYYLKQGKLVPINGMNTVEGVFQDICKEIDGLL